MKKKRIITLCFIFGLALMLLAIAMPYVLNVMLKSSASELDPEVGEIRYYKANLFDYKSSEMSASGSALSNKIQNDVATCLLFFEGEEQDDVYELRQTLANDVRQYNSYDEISKYRVVQGLAKKELNTDGSFGLATNISAISGNREVELFDVTDGASFRGAYSFPFENVGDGYLQFDSSKNHVEATREVGEDGLLKMSRYDGTLSGGFGPFDRVDNKSDLDENGYYAMSGEGNPYFGVNMEIPFVMSKDGKVATNNSESRDMMFSFSGEGEVWVYLDDKLVLELGGIHEKVDGQINFATGVVETRGNHKKDGANEYNKDVSTILIEDAYVKSLSVGRHKLQVFYLERRDSVMNCKIRFRVQEDQTLLQEEEQLEEIVGPSAATSEYEVTE